MVKSQALTLLAAVSSVVAFPQLMELDHALGEKLSKLDKRAVEPPPRAPVVPVNRPNTGLPPLGFNAADQYVDTSDSGPHPFKAPVAGDRRGQCPGLNAASNHGFLPRNGLPNIQDTISGMGELYNMAPDLSLFLAVVSVGLSGDPVTGTWSIGSGFTPALPLSTAGGLVSTHNKYEGDASFGRGDAYLNGGRVGVFEARRFEQFYESGSEYTFEDAAAHSDYNTRWSILNNPYYFSGPFSGLVAPAAHNFVINFMSNHSAETPGGTLDRETLKSFFAVSGEPGSFTLNRGQERVPQGWYRRPSTSQHSIPEVFVDLAFSNAAFPGNVRFGGNTGTTDSFTGVDPSDLTGGVFNGASLLEGNNGACFLYQASLAAMPSAAAPALGELGSVLGWALNKLGSDMSKLGCPQLATFDNSLFNQFPGANYAAGTSTLKK